ncbi:class I SAM-dependent methyltransferase [Nocardioides astragali]|uniref:Class I SAM-dependent methyltransferase n=1 Tax=Nocardioides astragali TaxID=1776736 RepID=A0ABW2N1N9_9ACTN|nr:class I SAM-dependent methyltransferase [Nocardioides astragali]
MTTNDNSQRSSVADLVTETVVACPMCGNSALTAWRAGCADSTGIPVRLDYSRCEGCGCRVLSQRVSESAVGGFYGHSYAPYSDDAGARAPGLVGDGGGGGPLQAALARTYRPTAETLPLRVLDFGCGSATFVNTAREIGWQTCAADFSEDGLRGAREAGHDVRLVDDSFWSWLSTERFDVVRLSHVIEHLYRPSEQVSALLRSLNPGGVLHIITPDPRGPACMLARRRSNFFQLVHVTLVPSASLTALANRLGASSITVVPETIIKDVWRSWLLMTGRVDSYEGAPEVPRSTLARIALRLMVAGLAKLGRNDRYHAFITR